MQHFRPLSPVFGVAFREHVSHHVHVLRKDVVVEALRKGGELDVLGLLLEESPLLLALKIGLCRCPILLHRRRRLIILCRVTCSVLKSALDLRPLRCRDPRLPPLLAFISVLPLLGYQRCGCVPALGALARVALPLLLPVWRHIFWP